MKRIDWNEGWLFSSAGQFLDQFQGEGAGRRVTLPHDAQIHQPRDPNSANGPDTAWYNGGSYVYTKELVPPEEWRRRPVLLELEGVAQNGAVFVNGQFAGKCPSPYSGFTVNLGKYLDYDRPNEIKVTAKTGMQKTSRWYVGGGLFRPVWLLVGERVCLEPDGVRITTLHGDGSTATVEVRAALRHTELGSRKVRLELTLRDPAGAVLASDRVPVTLLDQETVTVTSRMDLRDPPLWSVEAPNLCTAQLRVMEDGTCLEEQTVSFGVRTLTVDRTHGMRINGTPVKLRGACIHHDNGILGGISLRDAELRRAKKLKEAGFNAVRSAHNPASRALLEACDEAGLLVMDELFDVWNGSKRDHDGALTCAEWWQHDMEAIVAKDYNHPCVVMYTLGNEIPETGTPGGAALNRSMAGRFRSLDPTRPIVNCINGMFSVMPRMREIVADVTGAQEDLPEDINELMTLFDANIDQIMCHEVVTRATEETFSGVDICGYNYMAGRYRADGEAYPNRIIVGSETNPDRIGFHWPLVKELSYVLGDFCWTGWDFIGEAGVGKNDYEMTHAMYGPWPWFLAYCGDLDLIGDRRPQSYYREIVYGRRSAPYLCVERPEHYGQPRCTTNWTWPDVIESWTWPGFEGKPVHVEVYTGGDEAELFLDQRSLGRKQVEDFPCKAVFDVIYQPGTLTAVSYRNGAETGRMSLATAGAAAAVRLEPDRSAAPAGGQSLIYLELSLVDGAGRLNRAERRAVTLRVTGPAELAGFGSAEPTSLEGFDEAVHWTFDGRALAALRSTGAPGEVTVEAEAPGLASARTAVRFEAAGSICGE